MDIKMTEASNINGRLGQLLRQLSTEEESRPNRARLIFHADTAKAKAYSVNGQVYSTCNIMVVPENLSRFETASGYSKIIFVGDLQKLTSDLSEVASGKDITLKDIKLSTKNERALDLLEAQIPKRGKQVIEKKSEGQ